MKKTILALGAIAVITGGAFSSCTTPGEKVTTIEKTTTTTVEPNPDATLAKEAYQADIISYRKANAERIIANEKSLEALKAQIDQENAELRLQNTKRLAELEQKNSDLKKKLDDYKDDGKDNWDAFKAGFDHDLDGLGEGFKDLTTKSSQ